MSDDPKQSRGKASRSTPCCRLLRTTWADRKEQIERLTREQIEEAESIQMPIAPDVARVLATSKWAKLLPSEEMAHAIRTINAASYLWDSPVSAVLTRAAESYDPNFDSDNDQVEARRE